MAQLDIKEFIEVNGVEAINTIGQLREAIALLKEEMKDLQIGSEEYKEKARDLYVVQGKLADVMYASKKPVDEVAGSMNQLQAKLRELKEDWKNLAPDTDAFKAKTDEVNAVKAQINALNEGIGNYQHNVGNYTNSIIEAFDKMGISVKGLSGMFSALGVNVGDTSKVMGAILKVFQMFSPTLKNLTTGMKGVETATAGATTAMKGLKVAIASTGIGLLVVAISSLIANWDKISKLWKTSDDTLKNLNKSVEDNNTYININNERIAYEVRLMQARGEAQEEVERYIIRETNALIANTRVKLENAIATRDMFAQNSKDWEEAEAVVKKYQDQLKGLQDTINKTYQDRKVREALDERLKKERAVAEATRKRAEAEKIEADALSAMQSEIDKSIEETTKQFETELATAESVRKASEEAIKSERQKEEESYAERLALLKQWGMDTTALEEEHRRNLLKFRQEEAQDAIGALIAQLDAEQELKQRQRDREIESLEESGINPERLNELYTEDFNAYEDYIRQKIELNNQLAENYEEGSEEWKNIQLENQQLEEDLLDADQQRMEKRKNQYDKLMKARKDATMAMVNSSSNLFKALSQAMGESTKMGKGFAIAAAMIDTFASAVSGYRAGMNQWADAGPMAWMGPVQGALNATIATITGFAQIQKIQSVDTSGSASGSGMGTATAVAIPNIEGLATPYEYTRQVTTETEREEMNRDQRVYILESDIQESNNRVKIRENETTF